MEFQDVVRGVIADKIRDVIKQIFNVLYGAVALLFGLAAVVLTAFAGRELWHAADPRLVVKMAERVNAVLESIGLLTIAVAALELSQTVIEEEILRTAQIAAPTRVRRFLSRFLVVVVVALSIESLVSAFRFVHDAPERLSESAMVAFSAAAILAAWGVFIHFNRDAEELEPEAMADAKREDAKMEG